ncbi:hypothetical protein [Bradyrhizobium cenepequi]|uniref:hypothetical protein n=1 Tax=Bradyrhizobium cenepequi TaxID=2821403 RepID=UPI001CE24929|nr:hypothetical protein [Bradyrhizobium cenepequi]MCA6112974.1 hypothetical protein [Bradyrhizobium cenepequi]
MGVAIDVLVSCGQAVAVWRAVGLQGEPHLLTAARNCVDRWEEGELIWSARKLAAAVPYCKMQM